MSGVITAAAVGVASLGAEAYNMSQSAGAAGTAASASQTALQMAAQEAQYAPAIAGTGSWQEQIAQTLGNYQTQYNANANQQYGLTTSAEQQALALMANPSSIANTPEYQFQLQQGNQAVTASMAAQGYLGSGNMATSLENYAQGLASTSYNTQLQQLLSAAGQTGSLATSYAGLTNSALGTASSAISGATSGYTNAAAALGGAAGSAGTAANAAGTAASTTNSTLSAMNSLSSLAGYTANGIWGGLSYGSNSGAASSGLANSNLGYI